MSYRCDSCKILVDKKHFPLSNVGKSFNSRVTETRERTYFVNKTRTLVEAGGKQYQIIERVAITGSEIVHVTNFCPPEAKFFDETRNPQFN